MGAELHSSGIQSDSISVVQNVRVVPVLDSSVSSHDVESDHALSKVDLPTRPQTGWVRSLLSRLEGPWAPAPEDLPEKRTPEMTGNSTEPFRKTPDAVSAVVRKEALRQVNGSCKRQPISRWSSLYSYDVPIRNVRPELVGTTVLHISDVHFLKDDPRPILELQNLARELDSSKRRIDLLLISGDILTRGPEDLTAAGARALASIAEHAAVSAYVPGNHDYHGQGQHMLHAAMRDAGILDITNRHIRLTISGAPLHLYGVDDAIFGAPRAPEIRNDDEAGILLVHNLDAVRKNFSDSFDLILSGHTHWGEIRFFNGSRIMNAWGYCDNKNGHTHGWDMLTDRALSYVHPGLARYYARIPAVWHPPGFAIHTFHAATNGVTQ